MAEPKDTLTVDWQDGVVRMIDQRLLPGEFRVLELRNHQEVAQAIRTMAVRGAPARLIGLSRADPDSGPIPKRHPVVHPYMWGGREGGGDTPGGRSGVLLDEGERPGFFGCMRTRW